MNTLVAYFSASNVTKRVAERLATLANADLFEIVPQEPYTKKDLDWNNPISRSSIEMKGRTARPAIASKVDNISQYSHVFVGFPIWWYREPSIIDTFLESYDWKGIMVIPFCTSGGSELGDSRNSMQKLIKGTVVDGKRFPASVKDEELKAWADEFKYTQMHN